MPDSLAPTWIADTAAFDAMLIDIKASPRVAIDTEFHGERTYVPRLMLVQLATENAIYLVDPLADINLKALCAVLAADDGPLVIGHALHNDLEIIYLRCDALLPNVFDTQIAASFLGHGLQIGLSGLVSTICGKRLAKDGQMADWSRRPLSDKLLSYAADDVRYLLALHTALAGDLAARNREPWVAEENARLANGARYQRDPALAYRRVGRYGALKSRELGILVAVAAERERLAAELDVVPHFLVPNDLVLAMARGAPQTRTDLKSHRRLNHRQISRHADRWLAAIRTGLENPVSRPPSNPPISAGVDSTSALAMLLIEAIAAEHSLATQLLAKRSAVREVLQAGVGSREQLIEELGLSGWRAELIGGPLWELISGRIAVVCAGGDEGSTVTFVHTEGQQWCPPAPEPSRPNPRSFNNSRRGGRGGNGRGGRRRGRGDKGGSNGANGGPAPASPPDS